MSAARALVAAWRRLRREALGKNRRNLSYMVPWNARHLFAVADEKASAKRALAAAGVPVPRTYAELRMPHDLRRLAILLEEHVDFVVKPGRGAGGGGVLVITGRRGDHLLKASGALVSRAGLEGHCADVLGGAYSMGQRPDAVLVEYRVRAEAVLGSLGYQGVPDVRVLVFRGVPVQAMIRAPTRASDGRANLRLGGLAAGVDLASGVTTHGLLRGRPCARHPDLDCAVAGIRVPDWDDVLGVAARCYDAIPLGFLGVDVVLDAHLGPLVLELNARPGLTIQLANRRGLRPALEALVGMEIGRLGAAERVGLGRELAAAHES